MLTNEQITTVRGAIFNDQSAAALLSAGNWQGVQEWLNAASSPAYIVWRTSVNQDEIMMNGFDWTRVDNLAVGPARIWEWLFSNEARSINPSKVNVRAGIDAVWKGTAADLAVRAAVYVHCKRTARRGEQLLASGLGTDAAPSVMTHEGEVSQPDAIKVVYHDDGVIWTPQG